MTITVTDVVLECCKEFNVSLEDFYSKKREHRIVISRQMSHMVLKERLKLSYESIAAIMSTGGRKMHHTTVIHSVKSVKDFLSINDDYIIKAYDNINRRLDGYYGPESKTVTIYFPKNEPIEEFIHKFKKRYPDVPFSVTPRLPSS